MRTTVDLPDALLERARPLLAARHMTLTSLFVQALEQLVCAEAPSFKLRDSTDGYPAGDQQVSSEQINLAVDEFNEPAR
ncbi:MAG: hypothetical protein SF187_14735 [Deltaproteobacteria bacterium]|nr:hypothetical protein [Deltaproteobacteria bacterium]